MNEALPTNEYSHLTGTWRWNGRECKGADDATFVPRNNLWATDKKGLFKQDTRVRVNDAASCQVLNLLFAKDNQQVYYIEGTAKSIVDVASFEVLDSGIYVCTGGREKRFSYAHDTKNIYCHDFSAGKPKVLKGADRESFSRLDYGYAKDRKYVWTNGFRINKADPESFTSIDDLYSKDRRHVFYDETPLEGADPATFWIVGRTTGADAQRVYFQRTLLAGADPNTFRTDEDNSWIGRDNKLVFNGPELVVGADPETFEQIGDSHYYRDNRTIYFRREPVPGVDAESFEVLENSWGRAKDKYREYNDGKSL